MSMGHLEHLAISAGILLAASALLGQKASPPDQFRQDIQNSAALSRLETDGTAPFHLKASLKWLSTGNAGATADSGTIEVLWRDAHHYRITIILPSGKLVENDDGENPWRTGQWAIPKPVVLAQNALLDPYRQVHLLTDRVSEGERQEGQQALDCIDTAPEIPGVSPDAKIAPTTYCLAEGDHILRLIRRPNNWEIAFNNIQPFEQKYVARSIEIARAGRPVLWLRVNSIEKAEDFSILKKAAPHHAQMLHFHPVDASYLSAEVMRGNPICVTPQLGKSNLEHCGVVVLKLHVDTAGAVTSAEIVSSSNEFLSATAVSQAKQWRYSLSYLNDKIVSIDDEVKIQAVCH